MAESYFQHAEHYFRILNAINQATQQSQPHPGQNGQNYQAGQRRDGGPGYGEEGPDAPGTGDQPGADTREIPISAAPPES